jgi:hypothetical protein
VVAEGGQCGERRRAAGQLRRSPVEKKRSVRLATHQGFLSNREGGQGVTGADESTKNSHGGTVHRGGEQLENAVISVGLNGEGVAREHGGGHPSRSGSSAGSLVRCGGRSARARVGGYGGEENSVCARLKRVQNQQQGGSVVGDATRRQGEHGARHPGSCTGAAETDVGRAVSGVVREQGSGRQVWAGCEHLGHV